MGKVKFYDEKYLAKKLGIEKRKFHREIKPRILSDFPEILEELGVSNPDIGLDKNDNILLADLEHNNVLPTNLNIFDYICDENE